METIIIFVIKSILVSFVLTINYIVLLRNKSFHQYNRIYLLLSIILSLALPLMPLNTFEIDSQVLIMPAHKSLALWLVPAISCLLLLFSITSVLRLCWLKHTHPVKQMDGFRIIETQLKESPFSFFNNLYWRSDISPDTLEGSKIFTHELIHITNKHSYDKLFVQLITSIFWVNPFYWIIRHELNMVHEFIADEGAVEKGDTKSFARMLLFSLHHTGCFNPSHSFFRSPVKRRMTMIAAINNNSFTQLWKWSLLPVLCCIILVCSFAVSKPNDTLRKLHADKLLAEKTALK